MSFLVAVMPGGLPDPSMPVPSEVEVVETVNQPTVYRLQYALTMEAGDLPLLAEPRLSPEQDLALVVPNGEDATVLVKGPVTAQRMALKNGVAGSVLDVLGADYSVVLNRENKVKLWADMSASTAVSSILAAQTGIVLVPDVQSTQAQYAEDKHALVQRETDLHFIRRMAARNGYWFWFSYELGPSAGVNAHFKAPPASDTAALELRINMQDSNIDSVEIDWDVERPATLDLQQLDLGNREKIEVSAVKSGLTGLADQLLADVAPALRSGHFAVPLDDNGDLTARGQAALLHSDMFVRAHISAKASVLQGVVRAHTVVNLNGVGSRHSGKYLVWSVAHLIKDGEHTMQIELVRNGWNKA